MANMCAYEHMLLVKPFTAFYFLLFTLEHFSGLSHAIIAFQGRESRLINTVTLEGMIQVPSSDVCLSKC